MTKRLLPGASGLAGFAGAQACAPPGK